MWVRLPPKSLDVLNIGENMLEVPPPINERAITRSIISNAILGYPNLAYSQDVDNVSFSVPISHFSQMVVTKTGWWTFSSPKLLIEVVVLRNICYEVKPHYPEYRHLAISIAQSIERTLNKQVKLINNYFS
jgi:hypothetical protein